MLYKSTRKNLNPSDSFSTIEIISLRFSGIISI